MRRRTLCLALASALAAPGISEASTPQTWRVSGVEGWTSAQRESVGVTSEGLVGLALATDSTEGIEGFMVWALLRDGDGALVATGDHGTLYRVDADGQAVLVAKVVQPEITALGRDGRGRVLMGTSPDGVVYRLEGEKAVSIADTPETYIWKIVPDGKDGAFLATGNAGKLYRLDANGAVELLVDLECVHATGLALDGERLLVTTESPGRLLDVGRDGSVAVLYEAAEGELREPLRVGDAIYFLANPAEPNLFGRLYRRAPSGAVELVWSALAGSAYQLSEGPDGTLFVTTGADKGRGSLVRVTPGPPSSWMEIASVAEPQVICALLSGQGDGWLGTGGLARVYRVPGKGSYEGLVTSIAFDAGGNARWGGVAIEPGTGAPGVRLETRSGNTKTPDSSWSAWQDVGLDGGRGKVNAPPARFLQWRLRISDPQTRLAAVSTTYLPANLAPRVSDVGVTGLGEKLERSWDRGQPSSLAQELPGGVRVEFQVPTGREADRPADDPEAAWARRYRTVTWIAADPNDDPLRFDIDLRAMGETDWKPLQKDREASPWIWDSAAVPDGWYALRVTASDRVANPPELAATGYRQTEPFLVDNTPPQVVGIEANGRVITGAAEDASGSIRSIEVSLDGGIWQIVFPEDGIPDMPREPFRVELTEASSGDHVAMVRAADDAGNLGVARVSFRVP